LTNRGNSHLFFLYANSPISIRSRIKLADLATFTVDSLDDDLDPLDGVTTLREAITQANDNNNQATVVDNIRFDPEVWNNTINLSTALPTITEPVNIQVTPFFPFDGPDRVTINRAAGFSGPALDFNVAVGQTSQLYTVQGLRITNFSGHGISISDLPDDTQFRIHYSEMDGNSGDGIHLDLPTGTNINRYLINNNVITNNSNGIRVIDVDSEFSIASNFIGTDGDSFGDGNTSNGIFISASSASPTLSSDISFNTISGNGGDGIRLEDSFAATSLSFAGISSNNIGIDEAQTFAIPNGGNGIALIGSRMHVRSNRIGGNSENGVLLDDSDLVQVTGNRIGTTGATPAPNLGNLGAGVRITGGSRENVLDLNFIYFNGGDGVEVNGATTVRNEITRSTFRDNGGTPIDLLGTNGPTANDGDDGDTGGNELMNFPVLGSIAVLSGTEWTIPFTFDTNVGGNYRFEVYRYDPIDESHTRVKSIPISGVTVGATDFAGTVTFRNGTELNEGDQLSVLAVRLDGTTSKNTSELSLPVLPSYGLLGDYNRDGRVDAADYTIWRDTKGASVPKFSGADGSGNGIIDVADYALWKSNFGLGTPGGASSAAVPGDYNMDGIVDELDFDLWESTFGSTTNLAADGNFNGIVDLADLEVWQAFRGVTTLDTLVGDFNSDFVVDTADYDLWMAGSAAADADGDGGVLGDMDDFAIWEANFGTVRADVFPEVMHGTNGKPLEIPDFAPIVLNVSVGSQSFAGLAGSGEQLRSVTAASPSSVSIRFSEEVFVTVDALQVINLDGASPTNVTSFVYNLATQTVTWTFDAPLADGRTLLRLSDSVFDLDHDSLDGEFTNPWTLSETGSATFPSGDGEEGGEFRFRFTVLSGDSDHDNIHGATNYTNWQSIEPGMIIVSTTADEFDGNLSFGDVSLREAVDYANTAGSPMAVQLPAGRYTLSRTGSESSADVSVNDLDITGDVTIVGAGPGLSVITPTWTGSYSYPERRLFDVTGAAAALDLSRVTLTGVFNSGNNAGGAAIVRNGGHLRLSDSAVVNSSGIGQGSTVYIGGGNATVLRSVFTNLHAGDGTAITMAGGTLTVGQSIFALNTSFSTGTLTPNIRVMSGTKQNLGYNLFDFAGGGFFDTTPGVGDHLGTPQYVVTSVADTFEHTNDLEALSLREAVDLANQATGQQEIWLPAWRFTLTRDRGTHTTDTDVSYGDLDVKNSLVVRGIADRTSVAWTPGVADKVFDLLGDFNHDGQADYSSVSAADYTIWQDQNGSSGEWEQYSADADDDGDVDQDDYDIWQQNFGHSMQLFEIAL
jgi:hypothetical protein